MNTNEPKQFKNIIRAGFRFISIASFAIIIKLIKHSLLFKSKLFLKNNPDALNISKLALAQLIDDLEKLKTRTKNMFDFEDEE